MFGEGLLQTLLVSLDHLLDHLATDGASLAGGQVTVVTVGQVDTNLPWCPFYIVNWFLTGLSRSLVAGDKLSNRFGHNLTDELVKNPNALLIAGILPGHLHITLW